MRLLLFVIGGLVCLQATAQTSLDQEPSVLLAEERLYTAVAEAGKNVADVLDDILSADFTAIETNGRRANKASWLSTYREIASDPTRKASWQKALAEYSTQERYIKVYDAVAVVTGWRKRGEGGHRYVHVWAFRQGKWQLTLSQTTLVFPHRSSVIMVRTRDNKEVVRAWPCDSQTIETRS